MGCNGALQQFAHIVHSTRDRGGGIDRKDAVAHFQACRLGRASLEHVSDVERGIASFEAQAGAIGKTMLAPICIRFEVDLSARISEWQSTLHPATAQGGLGATVTHQQIHFMRNRVRASFLSYLFHRRLDVDTQPLPIRAIQSRIAGSLERTAY